MHVVLCEFFSLDTEEKTFWDLREMKNQHRVRALLDLSSLDVLGWSIQSNFLYLLSIQSLNIQQDFFALVETGVHANQQGYLDIIQICSQNSKTTIGFIEVHQYGPTKQTLIVNINTVLLLAVYFKHLYGF